MQNLSISGFAATETHHFDEINVQTEFIMQTASAGPSFSKEIDLEEFLPF
jgi:hypothetical protein